MQLSVKLLSTSSMKGVNKGSWAPAPMVALTIVPILLLILVTYVAIKCTTWAPALRVRLETCDIRAWVRRSFIQRHKRNASDPVGEELELTLQRG